MRVIEEWSHEDMRMQVFVMNGKYSLKVEAYLLEQVYKFRDGQIQDLPNLKSLLDKTFYEACKKRFIHMDLTRASLFKNENEVPAFEEII